MSASAVRIEANRNNAQFSTGPRTPEGKERSAGTRSATASVHRTGDPCRRARSRHEPSHYARFQRDQVESLNKFSMYEQRLTRNFQTTLKQFRELQAERREREEQQMQAAAKILKDCQAKQIQYDPAEDGFVFSTAEIETWMRRRDRLEGVQSARI